MKAETQAGSCVFAAVCDGMGGLKYGEAASSGLILALSDWFTSELPVLLQGGPDSAGIFISWKKCIGRENSRILEFARQLGCQCGTTVSGVLAIGDRYFVLNIGDSRVYLIENGRLRQITHDHTVVQRDIDDGRLTERQAARDRRRNILTRCVGVMDTADCDFFSGELHPGQTFLVCSDGFRHVIDENEMTEWFSADKLDSESDMEARLDLATKEIMNRCETDNISAALVKTAVSAADDKTEELPKLSPAEAYSVFAVTEKTVLTSQRAIDN